MAADSLYEVSAAAARAGHVHFTVPHSSRTGHV